MSSAVCNRLHGIFKGSSSSAAASITTITPINALKSKKEPEEPTCTNRTAAGDAATIPTVKQSKTGKPFYKPLPISHLTSSLQNLKMFIDRFKRASSTGTFRFKYGYYAEVVTQLAKANQHSYIEEILEHQKRYETDIIREPFVVRLILLYGKSGMYDHARKLFDEMPELKSPRTILSANALLMACVKSKRYSEMPELFRELREELLIEPDHVSYNIVIKAFCEMGSTDSALIVVDEMEKNGCESTLHTFNIILDALYQKGNMSDADRMWEMMESKSLVPDVRSYNAKIRGLLIDKRISEAVGLIEEMQNKGVNPDVYSYNGLINGFIKEDNLAEVKKWYKEMVKNEIVPDLVTFRIMIPFASKKGDFHFGFELSKEALILKLNVGRQNLKDVLHGLVKQSNIDEAKELVKLVDRSPHIFYKLILPTALPHAALK